MAHSNKFILYDNLMILAATGIHVALSLLQLFVESSIRIGDIGEVTLY